MKLIFLTAIPLLLVIPILAYGQQKPVPYQGQLQQGVPIVPLNFANTTWSLYNSSSGSVSNIQFNGDHTFSRLLGDNNQTGIWRTNVETIQVIHICPTSTDDNDKFTDECWSSVIKVDPNDGNSAIISDLHGNNLKLYR
jgi:hypothetical protein